MQISKSNYEAFFLDYWEGNLNDIQKKQLSGFLEKYPELQNDFLDFKEAVSLELTFEPLPVFQGREKLKKPLIRSVDVINEQNYEQWIVAYLEGDLAKKQDKIFKQFLSLNSHVMQEVDLYKHTFLKTGNQVIYDGKAALKKEKMMLYHRYLFASLSVAAAILLFLLFFVTPMHNTFRHEETAANNPLAPAKIAPVYSPLVVEKTEPTSGTVAMKPEPVKDGGSMNQIPLQPVMAAVLPIAQPLPGSRDESFSDRQKVVLKPLTARSSGHILQADKAYADALPQMSIKGDLSNYDFLLTENHGDGLLKRIAKNIGQHIFGQREAVNEQGSLLTEVANKSIETFNDVKNITFARAGEEGQLPSETVLALSDRLAIRIKKGNRHLESSY